MSVLGRVLRRPSVRILLALVLTLMVTRLGVSREIAGYACAATVLLVLSPWFARTAVSLFSSKAPPDDGIQRRMTMAFRAFSVILGALAIIGTTISR